MLSKICFLLLLAFVLAKHEQYEGWGLYKVSVTNEYEVKYLVNVQNEMVLDIWSYAHPNRPGIVLVEKEKRVEFESELNVAKLRYEVQSDNVKELLDLEDSLFAAAAVKRQAKNTSQIALDFDDIHDYEVVDQYLVDLAAAYPDVVTVVSGGKSVEGRDIKYLRISTTNFEDQSKPVVFIESLLHAREWITLPATLYAIKRLVIDVTERDLVEDIDWIILPIANPDGYVWSHENGRFWRKNRARGFVANDRCMGVDLNRNFDVDWGTASSNNPCSETFHGLRAFSEPESAIVSDILAELGDRMAMFIDLHSFGSMILYGYGNGDLPTNALILHLNGVQMAQAIDAVKLPTNRDYVVGNVVAVLYFASGSASDYGQKAGVPGLSMSYTFELPGWRGTSTITGFLVDPEFIEQAGFETWEGIKSGARFALNQWRQYGRGV